MKIVCDACSAKYSISDDKVQGKVFKIRCKKCSNIIVVRGNAGAAAPAEPTQLEKDTRVFDYGYDDNSGAESVWHVVIDQDQVGPLTAAEVQKRLTNGEIDSETYIWREGFADWLPMSQVDAFASLFAGGASASVGAEDAGGMFGHSTSEPRGGSAAVHDLFSSDTSMEPATAPSEDDGDVFAARRPEADLAAQSKLRGERGENSVLFSLSNLAQLASDGPRPQASSSSSSSSAGSAQHGGGEGSGLIDIRSMANAYLGPDKGAAKSASPAIGSAADLPVFASTGFGEPAVIVPIVRNSASNNKLLYGLVGLVGLLAVIAVVMVVVLLRGDKTSAKPEQVAMTAAAGVDKPMAGSATEAPAPAADPGAAAGATAAAGSPTEPAEPDSGTTPAVEPPSSDAKKPDRTAAARDSAKKPAKDKPSSASSSRTSSEPDAKPSKPSKPERASSSDCDAVACLVDPNQPCCAKKGGARPSGGGSAPKANSNLPEQLDSSMIKDGINKVKGRAQACGSKSSAKGAVKVKIKATPDGRVGSVDVVSTPDGALGSCVAAALRGATFAKTQRGMGFAYTLTF